MYISTEDRDRFTAEVALRTGCDVDKLIEASAECDSYSGILKTAKAVVDDERRAELRDACANVF